MNLEDNKTRSYRLKEKIRDICEGKRELLRSHIKKPLSSSMFILSEKTQINDQIGNHRQSKEGAKIQESTITATTMKEVQIKPNVFRKKLFNFSSTKVSRHNQSAGEIRNQEADEDMRRGVGQGSVYSKSVDRVNNDSHTVSELRKNRTGFTKVSKALNLSREDRDKLSTFVNGEELFNMISHQRHHREDYRQFVIKQMRRDRKINRIVRTGFQVANFDLEKPSDSKRLASINKAMYKNEEKVKKIRRTGLESLEETAELVNKAIMNVMIAEDIKPVSASIAREEEMHVEKRKDALARGLIEEKESGVLSYETSKPKLRWKWGFSLADQVRSLKSKDLENDISRGRKHQKKTAYDLVKNENQLRATGPLGLLGEEWLKRQKYNNNNYEILDLKKNNQNDKLNKTSE